MELYFPLILDGANGTELQKRGYDGSKCTEAWVLEHPGVMKQLQEDDGGVQFSHSLEEQIGGQLEAGFILTNLYEDTNGEGRLSELNIPTFLAMRSEKR